MARKVWRDRVRALSRRIGSPGQRTGLLAGLLVLALLLGLQAAIESLWSTTASFTAQNTYRDNSLTTASLRAPATLGATPVGNGVALAWTEDAAHGGSEYRLYAQPVGGPATPCPTIVPSTASSAGASIPSTPTPVATVAATATSGTLGRDFVDKQRAAAEGSAASADHPAQGAYVCYSIRTSYSPLQAAPGATPAMAWESVQGASVPVQVGFVASSFHVAGNADGKLGAGDTFTISFNQPIAAGSRPTSGTVCGLNGPAGMGAIILSATGSDSDACTASESARLGKVSGGVVARTGRYAASYAWSDEGRKVVVTLASLTKGEASSLGTGRWTFTPTLDSTWLNAAGADGLHVCTTNTGGAACLPSAQVDAGLGVASLQPVPGAPTGLALAAEPNGALKVSWNAPDPASGEVGGYEVWRGQAADTYGTRERLDTRTSYTDGGVQPGETYFVRVVAYNRNGDLGETSAEAQITMPGFAADCGTRARQALTSGGAIQACTPTPVASVTASPVATGTPSASMTPAASTPVATGTPVATPTSGAPAPSGSTTTNPGAGATPVPAASNTPVSPAPMTPTPAPSVPSTPVSGATAVPSTPAPPVATAPPDPTAPPAATAAPAQPTAAPAQPTSAPAAPTSAPAPPPATSAPAPAPATTSATDSAASAPQTSAPAPAATTIP